MYEMETLVQVELEMLQILVQVGLETLVYELETLVQVELEMLQILVQVGLETLGDAADTGAGWTGDSGV